MVGTYNTLLSVRWIAGRSATIGITQVHLSAWRRSSSSQNRSTNGLLANTPFRTSTNIVRVASLGLYTSAAYPNAHNAFAAANEFNPALASPPAASPAFPKHPSSLISSSRGGTTWSKKLASPRKHVHDMYASTVPGEGLLGTTRRASRTWNSLRR